MKTLLITLTLLISLNIFGQENLRIEKVDSLEYCEKGNVFLANYQFNKAIEYLNHCYRDDTENIDYLKKIALCNYKLGRLQSAKKIYLKILTKDSINISVLNQLAIIYLKESNYKKSQEQYQKLINIDASNSYYHKKIAEIYLKKADIENSIFHFEKAHLYNPSNIEVIVELSRIYLGLKFYVIVDSLLSKGRVLDATNVKLILYQAKSAYMQKNYPSVINNVNQILTSAKDTSAYLLKLLGISNFHVKNYQNAIVILEKITDDNKQSEIIHYYLGLAHREAGNINNSIKYFEKAINKGISNNISTYYTNLAVSLEEKGMFKESINAYQAAYKSSKDKILLYHLARNYDSYYKNKKTALKYYEMYLAKNDTGNVKFKNYSKHRISELKQIIHFDID
ncbi:MAG: hypothetical protein COA97_04705 [Flavobacteriales bacterium]|nr:MAG: hypothetical protein COA97_04705 [Flavobacteriales bacterium]